MRARNVYFLRSWNGNCLASLSLTAAFQSGILALETPTSLSRRAPHVGFYPKGKE